MVEPLGRRAEAESGTQRLEAEARDSPAMVTMEPGRPSGARTVLMGVEGEQRGCQMTAVEEAGAGGAGIFEGRAFRAGVGCHTHKF